LRHFAVSLPGARTIGQRAGRAGIVTGSVTTTQMMGRLRNRAGNEKQSVVASTAFKTVCLFRFGKRECRVTRIGNEKRGVLLE
jgi:hypothetical protein